MSNEYLRKAAEEVQAHLESLFGFESHPFGVYDVRDPEGRVFAEEMGKKAGRKLGFDEADWPHDACCMYWEDRETREGGYDVVMFRVDRENYPFHLGEEITHGEHLMEHSPKVGGHRAYGKVFSPAYRSMLGSLGAFSVKREELKKTGKREGMWFNRPHRGMGPSSLANFVGYSIASRVHMYGGVPYRELFRVGDQMEGWRMVHDVVPATVLMTEEELMAVKKMLPGVFSEMGFRPNLVIVGSVQERGGCRLPGLN